MKRLTSLMNRFDASIRGKHGPPAVVAQHCIDAQTMLPYRFPPDILRIPPLQFPNHSNAPPMKLRKVSGFSTENPDRYAVCK